MSCTLGLLPAIIASRSISPLWLPYNKPAAITAHLDVQYMLVHMYLHIVITIEGYFMSQIDELYRRHQQNVFDKGAENQWEITIINQLKLPWLLVIAITLTTKFFFLL